MRDPHFRLVSALALLSLATSCATTSGAKVPPPGTPSSESASPQDASMKTVAQVQQPPAAPAQLYARDGSVVNSGRNVAQEAGVADRDLAPSEGGRMYILELYQKAIDDRDALELEVRSAQSELERARTAVTRAQAEQQTAAERVAALEAENQRLLAENVELAARLTTAQIRRLQAEKLLLENRLAELRSTPPASPAPTGTASAGTDSTLGKL
jgi:hypothetical protein